ncbi:MAG: hypothetical protein P8Y42_19025 [Exilibacterium sp.]
MLITVLACTFLSACTGLFPSIRHSPELAQAERSLATTLAPGWTTQTLARDQKAQLEQDLYSLIRTPELQQLIAEALSHNRDLSVAALRLKTSHLALAEARSQRLPELNLGLN